MQMPTLRSRARSRAALAPARAAAAASCAAARQLASLARARTPQLRARRLMNALCPDTLLPKSWPTGRLCRLAATARPRKPRRSAGAGAGDARPRRPPHQIKLLGSGFVNTSTASPSLILVRDVAPLGLRAAPDPAYGQTHVSRRRAPHALLVHHGDLHGAIIVQARPCRRGIFVHLSPWCAGPRRRAHHCRIAPAASKRLTTAAWPLSEAHFSA